MFVVVVFLSAVMLTSGITPVSADDRQDAYQAHRQSEVCSGGLHER